MPKPTCLPRQGGNSQEDEALNEQPSGMASTLPKIERSKKTDGELYLARLGKNLGRYPRS